MMGAIFRAERAALAAHQPLPPSVQSVRDRNPTPLTTAPPIKDWYSVTLHGAPIFVTYGTDEDHAWVELIQCYGMWWEVEQLHRHEWIDALNEALESQLLAEAASEAQP